MQNPVPFCFLGFVLFVDDQVEVETSILPELIAGMMSNLGSFTIYEPQSMDIFLVILIIWRIFFEYLQGLKTLDTPPKFNMEPENHGFQKDVPFPGTYFQVPC